MKKKIRTKDADILFGPIAVAGFILAYDLISIKIRKKTISASIRHLSNKGYGPEISGAIAGCLIFHLFFRDD